MSAELHSPNSRCTLLFATAWINPIVPQAFPIVCLMKYTSGETSCRWSFSFSSSSCLNASYWTDVDKRNMCLTVSYMAWTQPYATTCIDVQTTIMVSEHAVNTFSTLVDVARKKQSTLSVTGKSSSTAHTGLGTMLRSSGSNPYTSPNCQVGFIPKQLTNYTEFESKFRCKQTFKANLKISVTLT